jgi:hypothetical protein
MRLKQPDQVFNMGGFTGATKTEIAYRNDKFWKGNRTENMDIKQQIPDLHQQSITEGKRI